VLGYKYSSQRPRKWFKAEENLIIGKKLKELSRELDEELSEALELLLPDNNFNLYKVHYYESGEIREMPSEVILSTADPEDYTLEAYSLREPKKTTNRNKRIDDRIDNLEVFYQITQGEGAGYAHSTTGTEKLELSNIREVVKKIFKGQDECDWSVHKDTRPWCSKTNPTPVDFYRVAELEGLAPDQAAEYPESSYMDRYCDNIELITNSIGPEAWELLNERDYSALAHELEGISEQGLKQVLEDGFETKMDELTERYYK